MDEIMEISLTRNIFSSEGSAEPCEGMEFESEDAARAFYNEYASHKGFKVRISSFVRSKRDKTIISRQLVCSREGFRLHKDGNSEGRTKRSRMITRVGCRAMIMVKKQSSGKWVISKCENIHNHLLGTQGKVALLEFDPYAHANEMMGSLIEREPSGLGEGESDSHELVVVPPEQDPNLEPHEGMEFESEQAAKFFYKEYARHAGFKARVSSYYRSKLDNLIISRLIVCSKEGFRSKNNAEDRLQRPRATTRVGCKAMIMVKKRNTGNWIISKLVKYHNHLLGPRTATDDDYSDTEGDDSHETIEIEKALVSWDGDVIVEPFEGMEFESEEAAKLCYYAYSRHVGFNMRVSTYYRSKRDKSIISRLFVCSREGFYVKRDISSEGNSKRPREATRVGCKAMLMIKKINSGKWVVSKCEKKHNHPLGSLRKMRILRKQKHLCSTYQKQKDQIVNNQNGHESSTSCREAIKYAEAVAASTDFYNVAMHSQHEAAKKVASIKNGVSKFGTVVSGVDVEDTSYVDSQIESSVSYIHEKARSTDFSDSQATLSHERRPLRTCNGCIHSNDYNGWSYQSKQVDIVQCEQPNVVSEEQILC